MAAYTSTTVFGPPTSGNYLQSDTFTDAGSAQFQCTRGGIPGLWVSIGEPNLTQAEDDVLHTALAGTVVASKAVIYDAAGKVYHSSASPAAAGSTVADATPLTAQYNAVSAADGTKGVLLPIAAADEQVVVLNTSTSSALKIYAITGSQVNGLGSTVAYVLAPGKEGTFIGRSATLWNANSTGSVVPGTATANQTVILDANKALDTVRATTERTLGGTGVPGAAMVSQEIVKEVTAIADNTATAILTLTVPNSVQAGMLEINIVGRLGAGGAIGADEAVSSSKYQFTYVRTAGVASVLTASSQLGVVNVAVAGAATVTAVLTKTDTGEGVGATNTHIIKVTIARSGGSSANHKCDVYARIMNSNASGATIA